MKRNDIKGKMFSDEHLSDYLLFNVPRIKVFFDLRAQSLYPDEIIGAYLSVLSTIPERMDQTIDILDRYGVSLIVLNARRDRSFSVATLLMQTKKWVCIFYDGNVVILVRADSGRFGPIAISGTLDELWYPKSETKIVTRAALSRFMTGTINSELLRSIIQTLHDHPDPNVYSLVLSVMKGPSECLDTETKHWLESEAERLAAMNYMVPDGFTSILRSLLNVLQVLEDDQATCGSRTTAPNKYRTMRRKVASIADELLRQYR